MVLQLDNVDGVENFYEDWTRHLPVIRRYSPSIERWRGEAEAQMPESLRRRSDASQLLDKFLWTMSGENATGDPTLFHDNGNGYGLMADRVSRTPPGSDPGTQLRNAWRLVEANPRQWTDWGEGSSYRGKPFGALGVIAPYDPDPAAVHPLQGGQRIRPPSTGDPGEGEDVGAVTQPQGWEPPSGYASSSDVPITEKLRIAREKRLRETGYIPPEGTTDTGAYAANVIGQTFEANPLTDEERARKILEDWRSSSLTDKGLSAASKVFGFANDLVNSVKYPGGGLPTPGGGQGSDTSLAEVATTQTFPGVQEKAGELASAAVKPFDITRLAGGIGSPGGPPSLSDRGILQKGAEEAAKGFADTSPLGVALNLGPAEEGAQALARGGLKLYDEAAVRLAANETFDRLAPPSLLRHERAGAAIAQEAAGIPVDVRSPFARTQRGGADVIEGITEDQAQRLARGETVQLTRQQGAQAGRVAGPEVAGGSAGRDAYGQMVRKQFVEAKGEEQAARQEAMLKRGGQTWADYGDAMRAFEPAPVERGVAPASKARRTVERTPNTEGLTEAEMSRAFDLATPSWEQRPAEPGITLGTKAIRPDGTTDYEQLTKEIRAAVRAVRDEKAGRGVRDEMARAAAAIREEGARVGREAGPEVSGGRATGGARGETPRLQEARANVEQLSRNLTEMAREGERGRFWYDISSEGFLRLAQHDTEKATKMAWIAAMGSPQTTVGAQGEQIMKAWSQVLKGEPVAVHTATQNARINKVFDLPPDELDSFVQTLLKPKPTAAEARAMKAAGIDTERGRKTANFFLDMLDGIDPERAARIREASGRSGATLDLHMARAVFGKGSVKEDAMTEPEYTFIEDLVKGVADKLGWDTKQAQAAIWASDIYRDPARKVSLDDAVQTYVDALNKNRAIVSWESAPGKGTPFSAKLPNFEHWSYAEQVAFHDDVAKAFLDENGDNVLAKALNIPGGMIHFGPGFYEGQVHPGAAFDVYLHPNMYDKIDQLAALTGYLTQQTAVPWTRPVYKAAAGAHNGLVLDMGRPMTVEEGMSLQSTLGDGFVVVQGPENDVYAFKIPGDLDFKARDLPASHPDFKAMADENKKARQQILDAIDEVWDNNLEVRHSPMATDGNYLENDWTVAPNGETYLAAAPSAQSPDVRTALGTTRARLQAAVDEHALRHANDPAIGLRDPRFDYGELQPVTGLVARQRDVTRTRGAAWVDPQGQIWLNNAPEHVDAILGGRQKGTLNSFSDVMQDGWVRVTSTKNPDSPTRQLSIHGSGDENTRAGADALINSLPESARSTTDIVISPRPDQSEYWMGNAQEWLDAGKPVRTPSPWDAAPGAAVPQSPDVSAVRAEGARMGRQQGSEVGGGSAFRPRGSRGRGGRGERPTTTWRINPAEGEPYTVETQAGPVSASPEEAQARLARNTAEQEALNRGMSADSAGARGRAGMEGVERLRQEARQRVALDPEKVTSVEHLATGQQYGWIDPDGNLSQLKFGVEHRDALAGTAGRELRPAEAFADAQDGGYIRVGKAGGEVFVEGSNLPSRVADVRNFLEGEVGSDSSLRRVVIEDRISGERLKMPVRDWLEQDGPIPGVGSARMQGARQGRMFGPEVGGGRTMGPRAQAARGTPPPPATPATPAATPPVAPTSPILDAVKGLGREAMSTPGAALSTVASYSPQVGRQGLTAFFMNPRRTVRNLVTSIKAGASEAEGERLLTAQLQDDWIKNTSRLRAPTTAGPLTAQQIATGQTPFKGYTWQDVGGTILDWRGTEALKGKTLKELQDIAVQHNVKLPANVTADRAREQIARDLRPELLEGLSEDTKVGRGAAWVTRPSSRQSATELNLYRTDWYKGAAQAMWDAGERDVGEYEKLRKTIEIFTQRGAWKQPFSFPAFFSTRAMSARVQMVERGLDAMLHFPDMFKPGARQEAGKALLALTAGNIAMLGGLYGAATAAGLQPKIEMDGKLPTLTVGDSFHFDPWAGINTPARAVFGTIADALSADSLADAPQTALQSATKRTQRVLRGGLSPVLGKAADTASGSDYTGQPYNLAEDIKSGGFARDLLAPMLATSTAEGYGEGGVPGAVATGVPSALSVSVNAYQRPEDVANAASREKYGRAFDDLTREERLGIIGNVESERERKALTRDTKKAYESDRKAAGYQDYWTAERKNQFLEDNPDLELQAWFHEGHSFRNTDGVDRALALEVPNKPVKFAGSPVDIARDQQTKDAWADSKDIFDWYNDIVDQQSDATARRMYHKDWEDLTDDQRSSVRTNIREKALERDPEADAWLYWWGRVNKTKTTRATRIAEELAQDYGPGKDAQGAGGTIGTLFTEPPTPARRKVPQPVPAVPARPR